ncbi:MAG: PaeR7I family type II restriction endonuclease [Planctomycetaceae bacterium]
MKDLDTSKWNAKINNAVKEFWNAFPKQRGQRRGSAAGVKNRKQLHGLIMLCRDVLIEAGLSADEEIFWASRTALPGYYRAERNWSLVAVADGELIAAIEVHAQLGPAVGNNFTNRVEQVVASATDLWAAFDAGAFQQSQRPWLGYLLLVGDGSHAGKKLQLSESHFPVLKEFKKKSPPTLRCELLMQCLRERGLYNATSLMFAERENASIGHSTSPDTLDPHSFLESLSAHAREHVKRRTQRTAQPAGQSRRKRS